MARGFGATLGVSTSDLIRGISFLTPTVHSFAGWYYKNGAGGLGNARIFDKQGASPGDTILRNANATSGIRYSRSFSTTGGLWETTDAEAFATGKWIHIVQTHDATSTSNNPVIYINGRLATVSTITAPVGTATQGTGTLSIGNRSTLGVDWDGALDDPAWWTGVILTAAEARALYQGADPRTIRPQYLTEYLVFSEARPYSAIKASQPSVTGTKLRAGRLVVAQGRRVPFAPVPTNSGTASITEAGDTVSATSALAIAAAAAVSEANDTIAATGAVAINATASITEANDSLSAASAVALNAVALVTEASDSVTSSATVAINAAASITEQADSLVSTATIATVEILGTASITEEVDTLTASAELAIGAVLGVLEDDDTVTATGTIPNLYIWTTIEPYLGTWAETEPDSDTWTPIPATAGVWANTTPATGSWASNAPAQGNWT